MPYLLLMATFVCSCLVALSVGSVTGEVRSPQVLAIN